MKIRVYFNGQRESGAYIQNAFVELDEDYTMLQLVRAIKESGYVSFMTSTMKRGVRI